MEVMENIGEIEKTEKMEKMETMPVSPVRRSPCAYAYAYSVFLLAESLTLTGSSLVMCREFDFVSLSPDRQDDSQDSQGA